MQQFVVEKVNRMGEEVWTPRVLTIDATNHILYLSQSGNVDRLEHHCMVQIKQVRWWPHYSGFFHSTAYFLGDSPLTFCIEGSTLLHGQTSALSRVFHPRMRKMTHEEQTALEASYALLDRDQVPMPTTQAGQVYRSDEWMLRCMTREDIDPLLAALRGAVIDPSCVRGTIRVAPTQGDDAAMGTTSAASSPSPTRRQGNYVQA